MRSVWKISNNSTLSSIHLAYLNLLECVGSRIYIEVLRYQGDFCLNYVTLELLMKIMSAWTNNIVLDLSLVPPLFSVSYIHISWDTQRWCDHVGATNISPLLSLHFSRNLSLNLSLFAGRISLCCCFLQSSTAMVIANSLMRMRENLMATFSLINSISEFQYIC